MLSDHAVLLPIDVQRAFDEPSWGRRNNPGMEAQGLRLLAAWRGAGRPVIHVKHNSTAPGSTLRPGQPGNDFKPGFEPLAGEALIEKTVNAAFIGTSLEADLRARGIDQIVTFGITTDMCVSTSVRVGANLGFNMVVVADACATFDQRTPDGDTVGAELLHRVHLTTLNTEFARVRNADEVIAELP
jgi:nicotinamidase-related amidase